MQTDRGLDTGPIVTQTHCTIGSNDTTETLTPRLAQLGADLIIETLPGWLAGEIEPHPQPEQGVTYAPPLTKDNGHIDWHQPAAHIARMTRAYTPWPGTFTSYKGTRLRILRAHALPKWHGGEPPGAVFTQPDGQVAVSTAQGALILDEIQLAGRKAMPALAFSRGQRAFVGSRLG
jgi:methionyl-tRNA formyltransferase